jgi:hypothetical protein
MPEAPAEIAKAAPGAGSGAPRKEVMTRESKDGGRGSKSRGGGSRSRGRRGGTRRRRTGGQESGPPQKVEPDREARTELLQEQLEAEFENAADYGDPLDPEEASPEDIAAELARSRRAEAPQPPNEERAFGRVRHR